MDSPKARFVAGLRIGASWCRVQMAQRFPGLAEGILPLAGTLARGGMIKEGLGARGEENDCWMVTSFGRACLGYLTEGDQSNA